MSSFYIRSYQENDRDQVISLWKSCDLIVPWNDPVRDIELKRKVDPELFLVAEQGGKILGTAMGGYEGHRGWIYYLSIHPDCRRQGYGRQLVSTIEKMLAARGCPKVNLMVRTSNQSTIDFYSSLGYEQSEVICLGKKL